MLPNVASIPSGHTAYVGASAPSPTVASTPPPPPKAGLAALPSLHPDASATMDASAGSVAPRMSVAGGGERDAVRNDLAVGAEDRRMLIAVQLETHRVRAVD